MSGWDGYTERMDAIGHSMREHKHNRVMEMLRRKMMRTLSCHPVLMNGVEQLVAIIKRTEMSEKIICSLPGEHIEHGGIVEFANNHWLITEVDADDEVYERGIMRQCNHILRWIGQDGKLKEKWCVVEDGTKYLIGEFAERMLSIGDARIAVTVGKDEDTNELCRGFRFLIDDTDSNTTLAYQITKPNKLFNVFEGKGVYKFILNEVVLTKDDNTDLRIADYNNWMPPRETDGDHVNSEETVDEIVNAAIQRVEESPPQDNKKVWL